MTLSVHALPESKTKTLRHTSMYKLCSSEKDATSVVMKGCPTTAASVLRSLRTCSTCFSLITVQHVSRGHMHSWSQTVLTIGLAEDLQSIDCVLVLLVLQSGEPYPSESA